MNYRARYASGYRPTAGYRVGAYGDGSSTVYIPPGAPALWFDAQNIDGAGNGSLIDGQGVALWKNLGSLGAAGNAVQATSNLRPLFRQIAAAGKINNLSALESTGTQFLAGSAFTAIVQPFIVALVFKVAGIVGSQTQFDGALAGNVSTSGAQILPYSGAGFSSGQNVAANTWEMNLTTFNNTASFNRLNGTQSANGTTGTNNITNVGLFALSTGSTLMTGMISECLVYADGTLSPAIEAYLVAKQGATPQ